MALPPRRFAAANDGWSIRHRWWVVLIATGVGGVPVAAAPFDPATFFAGTSHGTGTLSIIMRAPVAVRVWSRGQVTPDGTLILDQRIREGDKPERRRQWRLRRDAKGIWRGTLTDATGPVIARVDGPRLRIAYPMKKGMTVRQTLTRSADGQSADNRMTITKWGVVVARIAETITRD